jgi:hypothetical protein
VNYWKVILATVVIFGAGVVTGGLLVNYVNHPHAKILHRSQAADAARSPENHTQPRMTEIPLPRFAEKMGKQFVQELNDKLHLTQGQCQKIEQIICDGQERNHALWTNVAPKMRSVIQEVNRQIRGELTPEQQRLYEELLRHPPRRPSPGTNSPPAAPTQTFTNAPGA